MSERDLLLRAVCANPDDDTPRLVFADWLQENGEEARAEFIRLQIQLERGMYRPREAARLKWREQELFAHAPRWKREIPGADSVQFTRGFGEHVRFLSGDDFTRAIGAAPYRYVAIRGPTDLIALMSLPHLDRLECLDLEYATVCDADVEAFASREWPVHPKRLAPPIAFWSHGLGRLNDWVRRI